MALVSYRKGTPFFLPCEDIMRSLKPEEGPHQNLNTLVPESETSSLQNCEK